MSEQADVERGASEGALPQGALQEGVSAKAAPQEGASSKSAPRCAALVGPYLSGKTTLLEGLLFAGGTIGRRGSVREGNTVGDSTPEARARQMSTEMNAAATSFLGDSWYLLDCPGSVELTYETQCALLAADMAVVVCEPEAERAATLAPLFKFLDDHRIPHMVFINKMDTVPDRIGDVLAALQSASMRPLVLRQVPLGGAAQGGGEEGGTTGYVDLVSARAYRYQSGQESALTVVPEGFWEQEGVLREALIEKLADFDDALLEQILEDMVPPKEELYRQLAQDVRADLIVPVFLGSGLRENGVHRLWKALRHETPSPEETAARRGLDAGTGAGTVTEIFKTSYAQHTGKLSLARIWRGGLQEGMSLGGTRIGGLFRPLGSSLEKLSAAGFGEVAALSRMEGVATGAVLTDNGKAPELSQAEPPHPVYGLAIAAEKRNDDVKLSAVLAKLIDEDPTLIVEHDPEAGETVLRGQGEIHLQIALDRMRTKFNLAVTGKRPQIPYRETIRHGGEQHARFRRQSGGHGQFADIQIEVKPLPRGSGFAFTDSVVGGTIPKNYIPAVEEGVAEYLKRGPLGFPVVDVVVNLSAGQFHAVDSSDQAFKTVGRMAMTEVMPKCDPLLLEPVHHVDISVPNAFTAKVQRLVTSRRGQLQGYDLKPGWRDWDVVTAYMPQAELHDLIVELRSVTLGAGTFTSRFDHMQELIGKPAERVVAIRTEQAAQ